jgi:hypothetical protein
MDSDADQPKTGSAHSLSVVRAGVVLIAFVVGVAILVSVGTRPGVSGVPSTAPPAGVTTTTTTTTAPGHATTTTTTVPHSSVSVVVANATATNGLAAHFSTVVGAGGWAMKTPADAATTEATSAVYYAPGFEEEAAAIAATIGVKPTQVLPLSSATPVANTAGIDIVVVIGADLVSAAG